MGASKSNLMNLGNLLTKPRMFVLLILVVFLFVGFFTVLHEYTLYRDTISSAIETNRLTAGLISTIVFEHQKAVSGIAQSYAYHPKLIDAVRDRDMNAALIHLRNLKESHSEMDMAAITDKEGTLWVNYPVNPESHGKNFAYRDWYRGVSKSWKPYFSTVYKQVIGEKDMAVNLSTPVFDQKGDVIGILMAIQRTVHIGDVIRGATLDSAMSITLIDQEGNVIYSSQLPRRNEVVKYPDSQVLKQMLQGKRGDTEIEDPSGGLAYLSFAPIQGIRWSAIVGKIRSAILYAEQKNFIGGIIVALLIFLGIASLLFFFRRIYLFQDRLNEADRALLQSEIKFRQIVDNIGIGISLISPRMEILSMNRQMNVWFPRVDIETKPICYRSFNSPPREDLCPDCPTAKTLRDGEMHESVTETPVAGEIRNYRVISSAIRDAEGHIAAAIEMVEDITERKQTEEKFRQYSEEISDLYNNAPCGYHSLGPDGTFLRINDTELGWLGYRREEIIGKKVFGDLLTAGSLAVFHENFPKFKERGWISDLEFDLIRKNGTLLPVLLSATAVKDRDGSYLMSRSSLFDITKRRKAEEELRSHRIHLEELVEARTGDVMRSNAELQQFAQVASHDLQEPLRMVTSYLQLLERRYRDKLDNDARDFIDFAVDGASRMQGLIQSLLSYSRVETRGKPFEPTNLEEVFGLVMKNLEMAIAESGAVVMYDPLPALMADEQQLLQLFQNLIANAVKFHGADPPHIHIGVKPEKGEWLFSVKDNGIGFDMKDAERIFKVFQRLHARQEYPGTGIGLAVARKIVERHGGRIWVESEPGKGATFFFTLPMKG